MRLDLRVARAHGLSRRKAREYVETGRVDVDGAACREPGREVGDTSAVVLDVNRPAVGNVRTKLAVLHEDPSLVVVEKPAGLLTLATEAHEKDTLLSRVNAYLQHRYRRRPYVGVVHRLDKDTSGAIVFARSRETLRALQELFRRHDIEREYVAIVEGNPPRDDGTIGLDLVRDAGDRRRGTARPGEEGVRAVTHYRVLRRLPEAALVALRLETGRTHQIRVHLAAIGNPVLGDAVYRARHLPPPAVEAPRQMLHARTLGFRHPETGSRVFVTSEPPADFRETLGRIERTARRATRAAAPEHGKNRPERRGSSERAGSSVAESETEVNHVGFIPGGRPRRRPPSADAQGRRPKEGLPKEDRSPRPARFRRPSGSPEPPFRPGVPGGSGDRRRRRR
ncbi:MAG TPA: RluA family pseudouridine synthase [Thermoanaerobaculia bacterium]|nr:RluA family pseudouridine synthase [Thermoanaerobaculia bacterium]